MGWARLGTSLCSDRNVALVRVRFHRITDTNIPKNDALSQQDIEPCHGDEVSQIWFEEHII